MQAIRRLGKTPTERGDTTGASAALLAVAYADHARHRRHLDTLPVVTTRSR